MQLMIIAVSVFLSQSVSVSAFVSASLSILVIVIVIVITSGGFRGGGKSGHGPPMEIGNGVWPPFRIRKSNGSIVILLSIKDASQKHTNSGTQALPHEATCKPDL